MGTIANTSEGHLEPKWPPRSPHEALLSSPSGRQKLRHYRDRTSPSPLPLKRPSIARVSGQLQQESGDQDILGANDEEDEETLQLQLAAIEAKLKLKKLREKKKTVSTISDSGKGIQRSIRAAGKENHRTTSQKVYSSDLPELKKAKASVEVQIPVSPHRKHVVAEEAKSPGRVLLGIDKGLKGRNISLRRPAGETSKDDDPFLTTLPPSGTTRPPGFGRSPVPTQYQSDRPKSFSEKIAETRQRDKAQKERADKLRRQRSTGFGANQQEIEAFHSAAEERSTSIERRQKLDSRSGIGEFSRDDIIKAANKANEGLVHRSNTSAGIRRARATPSSDIWTNPNAPPEAPSAPKATSEVAKKRSRSLSPPSKATDLPSRAINFEASDPLFEPFSSFHLSKRLLPHDFLTRILAEKHLFLLPDLLSAVKSPSFTLPDLPEPDHVVLAIIASKSSPMAHKGAHKSTNADISSVQEAAESEQNTNGKYMALTLTDLKWTVDLFLFSTGYTRFRKLTPGTVVALLNPDIMPPLPGKADTGRFSLKLSSSDDTVLEIGTSRNLGWCKSVRKDGKQCDSWVDKRHTEFCEFHVDVVIERTRRGRMEVQGMSAPFAPGGKKGGRTGYFGDKRRGQKPAKEDGFIREGPQYDRGSRSQYFVGPSIPGQTAAQLLDAEGATDRYGSKEDRVRKRIAERERENEIARKLGEGGNGAGSEYLRLKQGLGAAKGTAEPEAVDPVDAASLGLLGNKARSVHLSPVRKRKASEPNIGGSRKKTRFVTEAGIKEAGREGFGGEVGLRYRDTADDDDELEVV